MKGSTTISVRVKNEVRDSVLEMFDKWGVPMREFFEHLVEDYENGKVEGIKDVYTACGSMDMVVNNPNGGVSTKTVCVDKEDVDDLYAYRNLGYKELDELFRKKNFPEEYIGKTVGQIMENVREMPDYNPRRAKSDD